MRKRLIVTIAGAALAVALAGGALAIAGGDDEGTVTGAQAERAVKAALSATDGGTANSVERDDENGAVWEVEVTKPDGSTVDVRLDAAYHVVVIEGDEETPSAEATP